MSDHRNRVRFVDHWTTHTGSDHRALFVHVQIRRRLFGPWRDLLLVSCNMGGHFSRSDLAALAVEVKGIGIPAVMAVQEAGDQHWLSFAATRYGLTFLAGDGRSGQASTPTLLWPGVKVKRTQWLLTLARRFIGKGAGPDRNKAKWADCNRLVVAGAPFGATSVHFIASQQNPGRMKAARDQADATVRVAKAAHYPLFCIGDTNSDDDQPLSDWLRAHGMTSNHRELGEIPTHGRRSIDAVWVRADVVGGAR